MVRTQDGRRDGRNSPTVMLSVRLPTPVHEALVALAAAIPADKSEVTINALVSYIERCGHDASLLRELQADKAIRAEVLVLRESKRLLESEKEALQRAVDAMSVKMNAAKEQEDAEVRNRVRAANEDGLKPAEKADLERAKIIALRGGVFMDTLRSLADMEARKVPSIGATAMHIILRRAFGSYQAAVDALTPKVVA